MLSSQWSRKALAEALGTFMLVLIGCGAVGSDALSGGALGHVGISLTFGLVIMVMIYATGHISGAHFNPAVTLGFAVVGRFGWSEVPVYILAQIAGAIAGAALLGVLMTPVPGLTQLTVSLPLGFGIEVVLSFLLMFVITAVATDARAVGNMAGLAIGGTVAAGALMGGPLTGASMNPARSLGPALIAGDLSALWLYMTAPVVGAVLGACVYSWIQRCPPDPKTDAGGCC